MNIIIKQTHSTTVGWHCMNSCSSVVAMYCIVVYKAIYFFEGASLSLKLTVHDKATAVNQVCLSHVIHVHVCGAICVIHR